jgi:hypothetical protein
MKFTIHTIKNKVLERLPFEMDPNHYEEILEVYFKHVKERFESLEKLEVDNPLGTFHLMTTSLDKKIKQLSTPYKGLSEKRKAGHRRLLSVLNGKFRKAYEDASEEEIELKTQETLKHFQNLRNQLTEIHKKKITKTGKRVNYKSKNKLTKHQGFRPRKLSETPE